MGMRAQGRDQRGAMLLYTLLLVALMGVALLAAVELDTTLSRHEREQQLLFMGQEFRLALERYGTGRAGVPAGQYPRDIDDLLLDRRYPSTVRHLRRLPVDPVTGKSDWVFVRFNGRIVGLHSASKERPMKTAGFAPDDAAFTRADAYRDWVFTFPPAGPASAASAAPGAGSAPQAGFAPIPGPSAPALPPAAPTPQTPREYPHRSSDQR